MQKPSLEQTIIDHPEFLIEDVLGYRLTDYQKRICRSVVKNQTTAVKSAHSVGKSWLAGQLACWWLTAFDDAVVVVVAPSERQVKTIVVNEAGIAARRLIDLGYWPQTAAVKKLGIEMEPKRFIIGFSPGKSMERGQGIHARNVLLIADEAAGILPEVWNALGGLEASGNVRQLLIGNPYSTENDNRFYRAFKDIKGIARLSVPVFDTPNFVANNIKSVQDLATFDMRKLKIVVQHLVSPKWAKQKLEEWGEDNPLFQSKVLAQFPAIGDVNALIPLYAIEAAALRQAPEGEYERLLSCDVARFGDDATLITHAHIREGFLRVSHQDRRTKQDLMTTTGMLAAAMDISTPAYIDSIGLGGGPVDRLRELGYNKAIEVNVAEAAWTEGRANLRAELYWKLREVFVAGNIAIPADEDLMAELANLRWKQLSNGNIAIEAKADYKKRVGRSPDRADSLMLLMKHVFGRGEVRKPVAPMTPAPRPRRRGAGSFDYDEDDSEPDIVWQPGSGR